MANFGPLAAEIDPVVLGIPTNFSGFHVLAALLHGTAVVGNLLNSNISPPHMSLQYDELRPTLAAEIVSLVWGTPANFSGFRVLAALLHGTPAVCVSQILRC